MPPSYCKTLNVDPWWIVRATLNHMPCVPIHVKQEGCLGTQVTWIATSSTNLSHTSSITFWTLAYKPGQLLGWSFQLVHLTRVSFHACHLPTTFYRKCRRHHVESTWKPTLRTLMELLSARYSSELHDAITTYSWVQFNFLLTKTQ